MGTISKLSTKKFTWIDINHPNKEDLRFLRSKFKFEERDINASLPQTQAQRPRASFHSNYSFLVILFPIFNKTTNKIEPAEVDVFITDDHLFTIHDRKIKDIADYFAQLESNKKLLEEHFSEKPSYFFYEMLAHLYHAVFPMLDHIHRDIKSIEAEIFALHGRSMINRILEVKSNILSFKRIMHSHKSMLKKMLSTEVTFFTTRQEANLYFNELIDHVSDIWGILETYGESMESLENTSNAIVDQRTNKIIETLTILTVLIFPLSVFAGLFSMNAKDTPIIGSDYDFWIIIGMMAAGTTSMYIYFKKKKWI